jgi:hypothetical protein
MPESELYAQLVGLREQASTGLPQNPSPTPILELDNSPERYYFPKKWCQIRQMEVAKTFEECDEVNECVWFLRKGLEAYEHLRHPQLNRRKRRRNRAAIQSDSDSNSVSGSDEAEATSDEESLVVKRRKQAQAVRNMETRMHELIGAYKRRYPQWEKSYDPVLRELNHRLERVE